MFFVILGGYNSYIKLKFSAFLSCVEVTKCMNFQIPRLMGFKVDIFRISPIDTRLIAEVMSERSVILTTPLLDMLNLSG